MTTELPPAGWYPDPTGKPGQKYWDGQAWTNIPATPQADIPGTPTPAQPPVTTVSPSGQRKGGLVLALVALLAIGVEAVAWVVMLQILGPGPGPTAVLVNVAIVMIGVIVGVTIAVRSGQSHARTAMFVIAMIVGLVAVPWVVRFAEAGRLSPPRPPSQQSQSPSPYSAPNTSSPSYQQGLKSGTDGYAEVQAFGPWMGTAQPYDQACQAAFNIDGGADPTLVQQDYIQGCLYGLNHQPAQWTQTRKTS
jgi:hypothetical protein